MTALLPHTSALRSASDTHAPVLSIIDGLHQGVVLTLDRPVYTIGTASGADLVLSDAGIAELHLRLRFSGRDVAVEALGGDVIVIGERTREVKIPLGNGHRAGLPLTLLLGSARLQLAMLDDAPATLINAAKPASWHFKPQWVTALAVLFLFAGGGAGAYAFRSEPMPVIAQAASSQDVARPRKAVPLVEARLWLDQQLLSAKLSTISVTEADGQLVAEGSFDPVHKGQWTALQKAFDIRYGQQVVLRATVTPKADVARPRVRFQAVWFGTNPYVINDSGKRLYPGAALADNWVLEKIENNEVILARGEERFTLTL